MNYSEIQQGRCKNILRHFFALFLGFNQCLETRKLSELETLKNENECYLQFESKKYVMFSLEKKHIKKVTFAN